MSPVVAPPSEDRHRPAPGPSPACGRARVGGRLWTSGGPSRRHRAEQRGDRRHHAEQQEGGQQAHAERDGGGHTDAAGSVLGARPADSRASSSASRSTAWTTDAPDVSDRTMARARGASSSSSAIGCHASTPAAPQRARSTTGASRSAAGPGSAAQTCASPATGSAPDRNVEANRSMRWGSVRCTSSRSRRRDGASARASTHHAAARRGDSGDRTGRAADEQPGGRTRPPRAATGLRPGPDRPAVAARRRAPRPAASTGPPAPPARRPR